MRCWAEEIERAQHAALLAGEAVLRHYERLQPIPDAPADITTAADCQAQELILELLTEEFPEDAYVAEEATIGLKGLSHQGRRLWVIDPIDGTRGFARKTDDFCVMIALVENGEPVLGVVHELVQSRMTWASRGQGCHVWQTMTSLDSAGVEVSSESRWGEATLATSRSREGQADDILAKVQTGRVKFSYSCGAKLAAVARGEADVYLSDHHDYHSWDMAAGQILVEEAGGRMTDRRGRPISYSGASHQHENGFVATNGALHEEALAHVRRLGDIW